MRVSIAGLMFLLTIAATGYAQDIVDPDPGGPGEPGDDISINVLDQKNQGSQTDIPLGGNTEGNFVEIHAEIDDPNATGDENYTLEVELAINDTALTGNPTHSSEPIFFGEVGVVDLGPLAGGDYEWQIRVLSDQGFVGPWVQYPLVGPTLFPKFVVLGVPGNNPPASPTGMAQFRADGQTPIASGASTTGTSVVLQAQATDQDGDMVKYQFEVNPIAVPLGGTSNLETGLVLSGTPAQATFGNLTDGVWHWRVRAVDEFGAASAWVYGDTFEKVAVRFEREGANGDGLCSASATRGGAALYLVPLLILFLAAFRRVH